MKGKKSRNLWSILLTIAMLIGMFSNGALADDAENVTEGVNLLAHYEFAEGGEDSSGNHNDAVIGEGVTIEGGVASLPGGPNTGSSYITLPKGMFDHQDTLTISMWIKDKDPRESWLGAFFIGSPTNTSNVPANYFYFVPCEKQHETLKAVVTDSVNETEPYNTEKGIRESISTINYVNSWTHYGIVLKPGNMTCYINGREAGTASISRKISDFGSGLESYIGKSNYTSDPLYQGDFKDFRVYGSELNKTQITDVMMEGYQDEISSYSMEIDGNNITRELSDNLYGLFYEDINSSADGGLYPEMVKNYSFENAYLEAGDTNSADFKENGYKTVGNYKLHWMASPTAGFQVENEESLNETNPHYGTLTGNITMKNGGFAPQSDPNGAAMAVKPDSVYTFSTFVKADSGYAGTLEVQLVDSNGKAITDKKKLSVETEGTWKKIQTELISSVNENTKGKLMLSVTGAKTSDVLCIDMVSLVPHDSYGYGNKNYAYGVGVRKDLLDLMMDLNPKFLRFPGGCIVEGFNWEGLYDWRDTIGPLEERKICTNRWENWNNQNRTWGYMQSYGFGYHELLTLCEDYSMEPFPILSAGVLCQYETSGVDAKTEEELQRFIDMATDLLDYCWGDPDTNEWAAHRAENGHSETFDLKYLGIGNENFQTKYFDNLDVIKSAVETYAKTNYPDRKLRIISSAGPTSTGENLEYAYDRLAQTMAGETLVDEHYYESESFMYNQSDRYDYYERIEQGGSEIFVGEYAVKNDNKFNTALAEAAYITGLERNADIVRNISYAPLLYKVGSLSWSHNLIYFDEFNTARSTNYYVQQMFGNNYGNQLIGTEIKSEEQDYSNYGSPIIGVSNASGSIDKVTIYDQEGKILFEDDFEDDSKGWTRFSSGLDSEGTAEFSISNGKLNFTGTNGVTLLYLPQALAEKWSHYKIVVEGAKKIFGQEGLLIGAGHPEQYYWYALGTNGNKGTFMEVTRREKGEAELTRKRLGNNYANQYYQTENLTKIKNNDNMTITFNYGVDGKLEGNYTSSVVSSKETDKYKFSSELNQYQTEIYQVVNKNEDNVYIKLVNPDGELKAIELNFSNLKIAAEQSAEITMLTGGMGEANAVGNEIVVPEKSSKIIEEGRLTYNIPAYSVNVIKVPLSKQAKTYRITYQAGEGGIIKGEKIQSVEEGDSTTEVAAEAEEGYQFQSWDDGITTVSRKEVNVQEDKTLTAIFTKKAVTPSEQETEPNTEPDQIPNPVPGPEPLQKEEKPQLNLKKITMGIKEKVMIKADKKVAWTSDKPWIATVSSSGKITGKKVGTAVITAMTADGTTDSCTVKVKKAPSKIKLNGTEKTLRKKKTYQIKVKFPVKTASYKITYNSSKKSVAVVSKTGKITAKKKGTAVITAKTFNGKKAKIKITVK